MTLLEFLNEFVDYKRTQFSVTLLDAREWSFSIGPTTYEDMMNNPADYNYSKYLNARVCRVTNGYDYISIYVR